MRMARAGVKARDEGGSTRIVRPTQSAPRPAQTSPPIKSAFAPAPNAPTPKNAAQTFTGPGPPKKRRPPARHASALLLRPHPAQARKKRLGKTPPPSLPRSSPANKLRHARRGARGGGGGERRGKGGDWGGSSCTARPAQTPPAQKNAAGASASPRKKGEPQKTRPASALFLRPHNRLSKSLPA